MAVSPCLRCDRELGLPTRVRAKALQGEIIEQAVNLCYACRTKAGWENVAAHNRRKGARS